MKKLTYEELLALHLSEESLKTAVRHPIAVILSNIRSLYNVGSIFRTADSAMISELILCGFTPCPPRKEILKTAGGEMVAPVPIEESIHAASDIFNIPVVIGDDRKYLSALFTLKAEPNGDLTKEVLNTFKEVNPDVKTVIQAMNDPKIKSYIQALVDKINEKAVSRAQLIRRWTIIPHEFTVDGGEITPTLKLKRKFITQKYAKEIEMMYMEGKF